MEVGARATYSTGRSHSYERLVAIGLAILAVFSPLFIDQRPTVEPEPDEESIFASWLPLLLMVLILAISLSLFFDGSFSRSDPYWIHRVGGSSCGILVILLILALVLKFKQIL